MVHKNMKVAIKATYKHRQNQNIVVVTFRGVSVDDATERMEDYEAKHPELDRVEVSQSRRP